ncbi:MAG: LiaI-LiaF-like domain-containing protein [bacterium]
MDNNSQDDFWGKFWGVVILGIGVLLLLQTLEIISWELWELAGPLFLIVWGVLVIRKPHSFVWCCCFPFWARSSQGQRDLTRINRES